MAGDDDERDVRWMEMLGNRGQEGVFDLPELMDVLRSENVQDVVVVKVPDDMNYAGENEVLKTRHLWFQF